MNSQESSMTRRLLSTIPMVFACVCLINGVSADGRIPAFPGAEGFGKYDGVAVWSKKSAEL